MVSSAAMDGHKGTKLHLIGPEKVRELLGVSRSTFTRMRRAGDIPPYIRITPRTHRWRESDVLAWLEERKSDG